MTKRRALTSLTLLAFLSASSLLAACGGSDRVPSRLILYEARSAAGAEAPEYSNNATPRQVTNVYAIDARDGTSTQLTHGTSFDGHPGWSPDYERVIFSSDRDDVRGQQDIYVIDADGGNPRALTSTRGVSEWTPKYSPDASQIAFVQVNKTGGSYVMLINADGSDQRRIAGPYSFAEFPAWRHDGQEVFFSAIPQGRSDIDIFAWESGSGEVRTVISTPAADVCPHFTRDGKSMTYASVAPGEPDSDNVDLFEHDLSSDDTSGESDKRLTDDPAFDDYLNPSPDGNTAVFVSARDGNNELYLMDRDGSNQRRLTTTPDVRENVPDW